MLIPGIGDQASEIMTHPKLQESLCLLKPLIGTWCGNHDNVNPVV